MEIVSVPIIVVVVYAIIQLLKGVCNSSEKFLRLVPLLSAILGAAIGVIVFFSARSLIPADNVFMALVIGGVSGLSSTGCHQVVKQLKGKNENDDNKGDGTENG